MSSEAVAAAPGPEEAEPDDRPRLSLVKETEEHQDHEPEPYDESHENDDQDDDEGEARAARLRRLTAVILDHGRSAGASLRESVTVIGGLDGIRDLIQGLASGSIVLCGRIWAWVNEPEVKQRPSGEGRPVPRRLKRGAVLLVAGYVAYRKYPDHPVLVIAGGLSAWIIGALMHAPTRRVSHKPAEPEESEGTPENDQETAGEQGDEETAPQNDHEQGSTTTPRPTEDQINEAARRWVIEEILSQEHGTNGIHLDVLHTKGKESGWCRDTTSQAEFRKALEFRKIPVDQVNVRIETEPGVVRKVNRTGVRLSDLPPRPGDPHWKAHASVTQHHQESPE